MTTRYQTRARKICSAPRQTTQATGPDVDELVIGVSEAAVEKPGELLEPRRTRPAPPSSSTGGSCWPTPSSGSSPTESQALDLDGAPTSVVRCGPGRRGRPGGGAQGYDTIGYPMGTEAELDQTIKSVEALDRRAVKVVADVRDPHAMKAAFETGIAELGKVDVICANASIAADAAEQTRQHYIDVLNVNLVGVVNTVLAGLPHLPRGGSVIVIGSLAALLKGGIGEGESGGAYTLAKRSLVPFVQATAVAVAKDMSASTVSTPPTATRTC